MALKFPDKDPDEMLDYSVDWSRYLAGSTVITEAKWYVEDTDGSLNLWVDAEVINGLQRVSASHNDTVSTVQISLGDANTTYKLHNWIRTASGLTTQRKILLKVRER
jgi:hypothetical protein